MNKNIVSKLGLLVMVLLSIYFKLLFYKIFDFRRRFFLPFASNFLFDFRIAIWRVFFYVKIYCLKLDH